MNLAGVLGRIAVVGMIVAGAWYLAHRRRAARARWHEREIVDITLEHTFPASDPPFWTNTTTG